MFLFGHLIWATGFMFLISWDLLIKASAGHQCGGLPSFRGHAIVWAISEELSGAYQAGMNPGFSLDADYPCGRVTYLMGWMWGSSSQTFNLSLVPAGW
jgi:hypothetical protein